jgi:peptidoglycan/LPS O-acetylase OafA/YrhL
LHSFHFLYGDLGVEIFFVISGCVVFMTLKRVQTTKEFIISRFARLFPAYWLCLIITALIIFFFPIPTLGNYTSKEILVNLTMFADSF